MTAQHYATSIAAFTIASLAYGSAVASTFSGEVPVGYSDDFFQIGTTSSLGTDISAFGTRDPSFCPSCYSRYSDNYTVNLFNQSGALLSSVNEINYAYFNMFNDSRGIGAGPVFVTVPAGTTTLEIISNLSIAGLLGLHGIPVSFGALNVFADGPITATTPLPATLPLLATGLAGFGLLAWRKKRRVLNASNIVAAPTQ
jgi:hypothetical protein